MQPLWGFPRMKRSWVRLLDAAELTQPLPVAFPFPTPVLGFVLPFNGEPGGAAGCLARRALL